MSTFVIKAGNDRVLNMTLEDDEDGSISGATITFKVADNRLSETYLIEKSTSGVGEIEITNPTTRKFSVTLLAADTEDLLDGSYWYEALVVVNTRRYTPITGTMFIEQTLHPTS